MLSLSTFRRTLHQGPGSLSRTSTGNLAKTGRTSGAVEQQLGEQTRIALMGKSLAGLPCPAALLCTVSVPD